MVKKIWYNWLMKKIIIKNVIINNNVFLAPIAGYTDVGFRALAKKYGAGLTYTEMVSAKALVYGNEKTKDLLITHESESPCAVQLFGNDPESFYNAIKLSCLDKFDIIDINMGCPAPKIFSNGEGSALMGDMDKAQEIVKACIRATDRPITVKFRSGINSVVAVEFAKKMEDAGASLITIHARTKEQGYSGKADLDVAKAVKAAVKIPVIVSGDCVDKESFEKILAYTKADGVMIARGDLGKPEIFAEILDKNGSVNKFEDIVFHINELRKHYSDKYVVLNMRSHIAYYLKKVKVSPEIRVKLLKIESVEELLKTLEIVLK